MPPEGRKRWRLFRRRGPEEDMKTHSDRSGMANRHARMLEGMAQDARDRGRDPLEIASLEIGAKHAREIGKVEARRGLHAWIDSINARLKAWLRRN